MISIENRINELPISFCPPQCNYTPDYCKAKFGWHRIDSIKWAGYPYSRGLEYAEWDDFVLGQWSPALFQPIDGLIAQADDTECLTSPSEYIRECKKWFMNESGT